MGGEGRREEENEVGRKDGEKKRRNRGIVRQRNNMRCIPTTNRECIRCQYHYTKQTLTMATVPSLADCNVYMIPMFTHLPDPPPQVRGWLCRGERGLGEFLNTAGSSCDDEDGVSVCA